MVERCGLLLNGGEIECRSRADHDDRWVLDRSVAELSKAETDAPLPWCCCSGDDRDRRVVRGATFEQPLANNARPCSSHQDDERGAKPSNRIPVEALGVLRILKAGNDGEAT